jgi:hypothetical protein
MPDLVHTFLKKVQTGDFDASRIGPSLIATEALRRSRLRTAVIAGIGGVFVLTAALLYAPAYPRWLSIASAAIGAIALFIAVRRTR